jgi:uncharacterized protein (TIGR02284 family)
MQLARVQFCSTVTLSALRAALLEHPLEIPMLNDKVIATLNELIETAKDGEKGFALAAKNTHEPELSGLFKLCEESRRAAAAELQDQVRLLGGNAAEAGSIRAAAHRGWISIKSALSTHDDNSILEECERAEDYAQARYADALKLDLPEPARSIVERQYEGVTSNRNRVRDLCNRFRGRTPRAIRSNV